MHKPEELRGLSLADRFWQHVDKAGPDECWPWTARCTDKGYGQFVLYPPDAPKKRTVAAHRLAYELTHGPLVNWGLHGCNNPPCCNPAHIYDGTPSQNAVDSVVAGTSAVLRPDHPKARGERAGNAKLTDDAVRDIRRRYAAGGISQQQLADEYGVNQTKISAVVHRRTWRHVA